MDRRQPAQPISRSASQWRRVSSFARITASLFAATTLVTACGGGGKDIGDSTTPTREAQLGARLLQKSDLAYLGAFRVPNGTSEASSFWYGGTALGYNPVNNSLFMTG
ncbi:MAG: hypothetical protein LT103_08070, partial [Burkholderiaceae bacterium]|nr:hypothetical protein [Burkholderiaceae bacterium]